MQDFATAIQKGDTATAWSLLSQHTQSEAQRIALAAQPDAGPEAGRQMLFSSGLPGRPVEVKVLSEGGASAEVQTVERAGASSPEADGGPSRTWHVVREGGAWRVDLPL